MKGDYDCWLGPFDYEWKHPPAPFNPDFRPDWRERQEKVRAKVKSGEPYPSREARAAAYMAAYAQLDEEK